MDEKSQIQALDRSAPVLPGVPERQSFDYVRHGTTSLFAALEVATGQVISAVKRRHRHQGVPAFLRTIDTTVPIGLDVHVILDNLATHKTPAVKAWLLKHPRFGVPPTFRTEDLIRSGPERRMGNAGTA